MSDTITEPTRDETVLIQNTTETSSILQVNTTSPSTIVSTIETIQTSTTEKTKINFATKNSTISNTSIESIQHGTSKPYRKIIKAKIIHD